jgi:hypothetical protein
MLTNQNEVGESASSQEQTAPSINVEVTGEDGTILNQNSTELVKWASAKSYLGLATDDKIIAALKKWNLTYSRKPYATRNGVVITWSRAVKACDVVTLFKDPNLKPIWEEVVLS